MRWLIFALLVLTTSVMGFSITEPTSIVGRLFSDDPVDIELGAHPQIARVPKCGQPGVVYKHGIPAHMDRMMVSTQDDAKSSGRKTCIVKTF